MRFVNSNQRYEQEDAQDDSALQIALDVVHDESRADVNNLRVAPQSTQREIRERTHFDVGEGRVFNRLIRLLVISYPLPVVLPRRFRVPAFVVGRRELDGACAFALTVRLTSVRRTRRTNVGIDDAWVIADVLCAD